MTTRTTPHPNPRFDKATWCFTGRFLDLSRDELMEEVTARGGTVTQAVTRDVDYLVIGSKGSRTWKFDEFGNKAARALWYAARGAAEVSLVSEARFVRTLADMPAHSSANANRSLQLLLEF